MLSLDVVVLVIVVVLLSRLGSNQFCRRDNVHFLLWLHRRTQLASALFIVSVNPISFLVCFNTKEERITHQRPPTLPLRRSKVTILIQQTLGPRDRMSASTTTRPLDRSNRNGSSRNIIPRRIHAALPPHRRRRRIQATATSSQQRRRMVIIIIDGVGCSEQFLC